MYWLLIVIAFGLGGIQLETAWGTLTPERALSPVLLPFALLFLRERNCVLTTDEKRAQLAMAVFLVVAGVSSFQSAVDQWAVKMYGGLLLSVAYFIVVSSSPARFSYYWERRWFSFAVTALVTTPLLIYWIGLTGGYSGGIFDAVTQTDSAGTRIRGFVYEANVYGCIVGAFLIIQLARGVGTLTHRLNLVVLVLTLYLTGSRGPWAGCLVGVISYTLLRIPRAYNALTTVNIIARSVLYSLTLIIIALVLTFGAGVDTTEIQAVISRSNTVDARMVMWGLAWESYTSAPLLGNGIFSLSAIFPDAPTLVGSESFRSAWISNIFLAIIHDSGILGFLMFFYFVFNQLVRGVKSVRLSVGLGERNCQSVKMHSAFVSIAVLLIISGLSIPTYSLAFFWILLGSLRNYNVISESRVAERTSVASPYLTTPRNFL